MSNVNFDDVGLSLPALRGIQGERIVYLALPSNGMLNTFFPIDIEPMEDRSQRQLDPRHAREISDYVAENPADHVLGAITYATDSAGRFEEASRGSQIGILTLPLTAKLRSIDGQHRREGIRQAMDVLSGLESQNTALLIYVEPDLVKRRQMFSDMNNTAKKVARTVNVAFDSRDPFARVVNAIADEHALLAGRVEVNSARVSPGSGKIYTLGAIHDAVKRLFVGPSGRVKDPYKFQADEIQARAQAFFDLLQSSREEFRGSTISETSILFSSTTLRVVAGAVWMASYDDAGPRISIEDVSKHLSKVDFDSAASIWSATGFVSPGRATPNARSQEVLAATVALKDELTGTSEIGIRV